MTRAVALFCLWASVAQASDGWFGDDKALHFSGAAVIASGTWLVAAQVTDDAWRCALSAAGASLLAGAAKELFDLAGAGTASWRDVTWDALGTAAGVLVSWAVHHWVKPLVSQRAGSALSARAAVW